MEASEQCQGAGAHAREGAGVDSRQSRARRRARTTCFKFFPLTDAVSANELNEIHADNMISDTNLPYKSATTVFK